MAERTCEQCGRTFEALHARFCSSTCRSRRSRGEPPRTPGRRRRPPDLRIRDAVMAELKAVGRESSSGGLLALDLATALGQRDLTPAAKTNLAAALRSALVAAMDGARKRTGVDELKERRNGKRNSARRSAGRDSP